jgi:hypothetical protein
MKPKRDFRPMGEYVIRWIEESRDVAPATMSVASLLVSMGRTPRSNGSRGQRTSRIFAAIGHLSMQLCNAMRTLEKGTPPSTANFHEPPPSVDLPSGRIDSQKCRSHVDLDQNYIPAASSITR